MRTVASDRLTSEERDSYGQRVVDYFSDRPHRPYDEAETLEDVRDGLHVVRTLIKMGRYDKAVGVYRGDLSRALLVNLEAEAEVLAVFQHLLKEGWGLSPKLGAKDRSYLGSDLGRCLCAAGAYAESVTVVATAMLIDIEAENWAALVVALQGIANALWKQNRPAAVERVVTAAHVIAVVSRGKEGVFTSKLFQLGHYSFIGRWREAEDVWRALDAMGRNWSRASYRPGTAERCYALLRFWRGDLEEQHLSLAENLAVAGKDRGERRTLCALRGEWRLSQGEWALAAESLQEAVRLARAVGKKDDQSETQLALAKLHLGQLPDPRPEAERLAGLRQPSHLALAELWLAIGDREQAKKHALAEYRRASADGEPYVRRYELNKATALLNQLGAAIPSLRHYDPDKDEKFPWESQLAEAIEKLRAETKARESEESDARRLKGGPA